MVDWCRVTHDHVVRAIKGYDRLGPEGFFAAHGFAPATTYELAREERRCPPKVFLGAAYEFATGQRLGCSDFEGGTSGLSKRSRSWDSLSGRSESLPSKGNRSFPLLNQMA